jgi:hypothetical protein
MEYVGDDWKNDSSFADDVAVIEFVTSEDHHSSVDLRSTCRGSSLIYTRVG